MDFKNRPALEPCRPPLFLSGGHRQTILGHFLAHKTQTLEPNIEYLDLPDGDSLALEYHAAKPSREPVNSLVIGFHGLGGSARSDYMLGLAQAALSQNSDVVLVNHRGCGAGRGLAKKPYHSGCMDDLSAVVTRYRERYKKIIAVGYSLSGNALLLLMSHGKTREIPDAAISFNAPINLFRAAELLPKGLNRIYDFRFIKNLKEEIRGRGRDLDLNWKTTMPDLDSLYTAPEIGFASREEYYEKCSSLPHLQKIERPTIIVSAKNDPFVDYRDYLKIEASPYIHVHLEEQGGHMGYLAFNRKKRIHSWMDYALNEYMKFLKAL